MRRVRTLLLAAVVAVAAVATFAIPVFAQWPTTCVDLNDIVEAHLGRDNNVGIYQRVFGDQAEAGCQGDHREDVRGVFAWAFDLAPPAPSPAVAAASLPLEAELGWPTTCVDLNDIVENHLGHDNNVGIYQRVFGDQAEAGCRGDHREDVRGVFAWAFDNLTTARAQSGSDRAALVAFYHGTGGASWDANSNWLSDRPIGEWHGVTTDSNGQVIELTIPGNNLTGALPAELGRLSNLTDLVLYNNGVTGEIPPELGGLSNLIRLSLDSNRLTGEIPPELGGLSNLTGLFLHRNQLTGEIPPELGRLSNLTQLGFDRNQLTGEIPPELGGLSNLTHLFLSSNQLRGCIPKGLRDIANNDLALLNLPDCGAATPGATATPTATPAPASEGAAGVCHVGLIVSPGESCTYPGTSAEFSVDSSGTGRFLFFTAGTGISARNTTINGVTYNFKASKQGDGTWIIEAAGDS